MSREFSRREIVLGGVGMLISTCTPSIISERQAPQAPEVLRTTPQMGDVLRYNNLFFLLRRGKLFPIADFETYRRRTELDKYGRKTF